MTLDQVAAVLILFAVVDVLVTIFLAGKALQLREPALEERATASTILTLAALLIAFLSAAYLLDVEVPETIATVLLVAGLMAVSVPQLIWALAYWRGTFR